MVLVDEWQDTNKVQYLITKILVARHRNITCVGDASQSIYSWRGADFRNINNLIKDFPDITVINLEQNYRSTKVILEAANSIIKKNKSHPVLSLWTQNQKGEKDNSLSGTKSDRRSSVCRRKGKGNNTGRKRTGNRRTLPNQCPIKNNRRSILKLRNKI